MLFFYVSENTIADDELMNSKNNEIMILFPYHSSVESSLFQLFFERNVNPNGYILYIK